MEAIAPDVVSCDHPANSDDMVLMVTLQVTR